VGDFVQFEWEEDQTGTIVSIGKRKNFIARKSVNLSKQTHILAANIDRCYLLVTLKNPFTQQAFIDRFLVSSESFRIPVTLLFNKKDLYSEKEETLFAFYAENYPQLGYPCLKISATNTQSVEFLKNEIKQRQVVFAGHSGTGKSTLLNAIDPAIQSKTGDISASHLQGKHTTTFAEMHPISSGGYIIDTPGVKAFGLSEVDKNILSHYFPEMRSLLNHCKFHNCLHINEPNCAVKESVSNGKIHPLRYESYLQMMQDDENSTYR
jgi:ribosome biogenesis GTPase